MVQGVSPSFRYGSFAGRRAIDERETHILGYAIAFLQAVLYSAMGIYGKLLYASGSRKLPRRSVSAVVPASGGTIWNARVPSLTSGVRAV